MIQLAKWLRKLMVRPKKRVMRPKHRRLGQVLGRVVVGAYQKSLGSHHKRSRFANEVVDVPAYEDRAMRGERAPHRFRWRGRWYRVVDVAAQFD